VSAVRLGSLVLAGVPADLSGEISAEIRAWGNENGILLLPLSFSGDYAGYVSPDEYFTELRNDGSLAYETGLMSWTGPYQGSFFSEVIRQAVSATVSPAP
jgi:hypothetical protein